MPAFLSFLCVFKIIHYIILNEKFFLDAKDPVETAELFKAANLQKRYRLYDAKSSIARLNI